MKKITTKLVASLLFVLGLVFGSLSISTTFSSAPAFAIEGEEDTPTPEETAPVEGTVSDPTDAPATPQAPPETQPDEDSTPADDPNGPSDSDESEGDTPPEEDTPSGTPCSEQTGSLSWLICPLTDLISSAVDGIYSLINDFLVVNPISTESSSPIYIIWQYVRSITNFIFIIFLLIVILSQITGLGITNYGIKRVLPRLIIAVILVNLSFLICSLAVDLSNIIGNSLRGFFGDVQDTLLQSLNGSIDIQAISFSDLVGMLIGGGAIAGIAISLTGGLGALFWMLVPVLLGALVAVVTGLITIAGRQAIIALLIMISPLAFVAYLLPNTEKWFTSWKNLLIRMLVFYPLFSFLYGASQLTGWALIASAKNAFGVVLGLAVQVFPLFFSWSLMKMSGTILGTINDGLRKAVAPLQNVGSNWALEHSEMNRQLHIGQDEHSGARLRRYLDTRREMRLNAIRNATEIRHDRAIESAMTKSASITGRDEQGNTTWKKKPNKYSRTAKSASYHHTLASNAASAYQNTLSGYGRHFEDDSAQRLADQHGEAFLDSMAQQYLTVNEAQADQEWLLDQYLSATNNKNRNVYQYNRLIKDAAGGLGHNGESSIMGQVIANSSLIENRRRAEARIIMTKFGIDKQAFRAMITDKYKINDNGYETTDDGTEIEDEQYNLKCGPDGKPLYKRREYPFYIAVHKRTGKELTKEEYLNLSDHDRESYRKVRYYDILNDDKDPVQRVFFDDAGYMKEMLGDDIAIGDPINRRYMTMIGTYRDGDKTVSGPLRKYASTVATKVVETRYKDHAAGITPMSAAQARAGYINSKGEYNIAEVQSFIAAGKAGSFMKNDGVIIRENIDFIRAITDDDIFAKYFPDEAIENYKNVNGIHLKGLRKIIDPETGEFSWQKINQDDPTITLEERKNLLRHEILPKYARKVISSINRKLTPGVLDDMKPDGQEALEDMLAVCAEIALKDAYLAMDDSIEAKDKFEKLINPKLGIFDSNDPDQMKRAVGTIKGKLHSIRNDHPPNDPPSDGNNTPPDGQSPRGGGPRPHTPGGPSGSGSHGGAGAYDPNPYRRSSIDQFIRRQERYDESQHLYEQRNSFDTIMTVIEGFFAYASDYDALSEQLIEYFNSTEVLQPHVQDCQDLIDNNQPDLSSSSTVDAIYNSTHYHEVVEESIEKLHADVEDLIRQANTF